MLCQQMSYDAPTATLPGPLRIKASYAVLTVDFTKMWCILEEDLRIDEAAFWLIGHHSIDVTTGNKTFIDHRSYQ